MKKLFLFLFLLFLSGGMFAQQLSWRFANPRIIRLSNVDHLQFDVQVKCDVADTYLWAATVKLNFLSATFNNTYTNWVVTKVGAFNGLNTASGLKYTVTRSITGSAPSKVYNIALTGDPAVKGNDPTSPDDFAVIPTDWTTMITVSARLLITTGDALAGIDFLESGMNGFELSLASPGVTGYYTDPNIFDSRNFANSYTGRFYSTFWGWSQIGGPANNVQYLNWGTTRSTTVWEDAAITQTDNTAALATNLVIGNGSAINPVLTIPANKWLTVSGALTSPAAANLIVESDGSLIHNTADVPGTIKRVISGSADLNAMMYHFVSIPLTAASSPTSNLFLGSYLYDFTEATGAWHGLGSPTTTPLDVAKGYMMYYPGASVTNTFAGFMNNGAFTPVTTRTGGGFNLVPNPYPSAIGWLTGSWVKTGLDNAIYIWPAGAASNSGNYASFVGGVGNNGGTQFVPVAQSFLVHANAAPVLTVDNTARVHSTQAFWKDGEVIPNLLRINTVANDAKDEAVVRFAETATNNFDSDWDAYKMEGGADAPQLSSIAEDNSKLSINSLTPSAFESIVPLNFSFSSATDVSFTASGMESFDAHTPIYLEDQMLNKSVNLRENPVYTFSYLPGNDVNRFRLHFAGPTGIVDPGSVASGTGYIVNNFLYVQVPAMEGQKAQIKLFNTLGQQITYNQEVMNGLVQIPVTLSTGVYVVRVTSGTQSFVTKVVKN